MNNRIHTTIILAAAAFAACSGSERADIAPVTETSRIMLVREGAADVSVYAFRREGAVFLFDTLFREGWTPDGKLSVRLPNGHYKFLFASGAADRIALQPAPLTRQTSWEEAAFVLRENAAVPGTCFPADELFLQYPASGANTVYTIDGAAQTVRARLTRAVCRIAVIVKRGYHDGTRYVEVPYAKPQSVLGQIGRIELSADHTGQRVNPDGSSGTATVTATLAAADYAELTDAGFVRFDAQAASSASPANWFISSYPFRAITYQRLNSRVMSLFSPQSPQVHPPERGITRPWASVFHTWMYFFTRGSTSAMV